MKLLLDVTFLRIFFAVCACSWMPHWACHYYRLETHSSFVVGSWTFSEADSIVSLFVYTLLIVLNLTAIPFEGSRVLAAALTAIGHLIIGSLHAYRLVYPFTFEVFGYPWSYSASLREALIVLPVGLLSLLVAIAIVTESVRRSQTSLLNRTHSM